MQPSEYRRPKKFVRPERKEAGARAEPMADNEKAHKQRRRLLLKRRRVRDMGDR